MRLVTRSDFDGLVCAVLLVEKGIVDEYMFTHPKDVQDGIVEVTKNDILANVPFVDGCGFWFDHHSSEDERLELKKLNFQGDSRPAPSAAQVIWDYYGGVKEYGSQLLLLLDAVNKMDSGNLTHEEVLNPDGWILLAFIMDSRTGLGRFKDYIISNHQLMMDMVQYCRALTPEQIVVKEDIQERVIRYFDQQDFFVEMMMRCTTLKDNVSVTILKDEEPIYSGNRFLVYALFQDQNVDVRVMWGKNKQNIVIACGHSILNRSCQTNIGKLMLKYGGGGHNAVGTCQVPIENWENILDEIVEQLRQKR